MTQTAIESIVEKLAKTKGKAHPAPAQPSRPAGRPRLEPEKGPMIGRPLSIHLSTMEKVNKAAAISGVTPAAWMRRAIEEALHATGHL